MARGRRRWKRLSAGLVAAGLIWGGRAWWIDHRYRVAMAEIESDIVARRYATACRKLDNLLAWKADPNGGIVYLLGSCELARGRNEAAIRAWERVVPGTEFAERAIRGRMRLSLQAGQLAAAERLIRQAAEDRRNDRTAMLIMLVPAYDNQGRIDEARRLIEARWEHLDETGEGASDPAIKLVRMHIDLTFNPTPAEAIRSYLDQAARQAPEDDRVWLGRANLAIRTGDYDEARRWLDECLRSRAEDMPVWRAQLNWAIASDRPEAVRPALTHLLAEESSPAQVHRLNAWLAAHRGDVDAGRRALERLCEVDPADRTALDQLAGLAERNGDPDRSAALRREKSEIERAQARYVKLHERKQPIRDAVELAHLAERLGRIFEARGFLTIAISEDPDREDLRKDLARLRPGPTRSPARGQTLAELVAADHEGVAAPSNPSVPGSSDRATPSRE